VLSESGVYFAGRLQETRRHVEAATLLSDYADVRCSLCVNKMTDILSKHV